jgi:hypothetical protein
VAGAPRWGLAADQRASIRALRSSARPAPLAGRIVTTLPMWYCGLVRGDEAYDVFLSYSRADSDAAETLRARLKEAGLNAFLDLCDCSAKAWALP